MSDSEHNKLPPELRDYCSSDSLEPGKSKQSQAASSDAERKLEEELQAIRKEERRGYFILAILLVFLTAYSIGINVWLIINATPKPYTLNLSQTFPDDNNQVEYSLSVQWDKIPEITSPIRPQLLLNNTTALPTDSSYNAAARIDLNKKHTISFDIPSDVSPGKHSGNLVFSKVKGDIALPSEVTRPLTIDVTGSWLKNWWVLTGWIGILLFIYIIMQLFSRVGFIPATSGKLYFCSLGGTTTTVSLKTTWSDYRNLLFWRNLLFPCFRNTISLKRVWPRKSKDFGFLPSNFRALIEFRTGIKYPSLIIPFNNDRKKIARRVRQQHTLVCTKPVQGSTCPVGLSNSMTSKWQFIYNCTTNRFDDSAKLVCFHFLTDADTVLQKPSAVTLFDQPID